MKPILFNTEMVRAILADRKTVTRRVVKQSVVDKFVLSQDNKLLGSFDNRHPEWGVYPTIDDSPYRPGDILYIPQAWKCVGIFGELGYEVEFQDGQRVKFKFENRERAKKWAKYRDKPVSHWQSPYFMPREAARLFLWVTDVWMERLQDITEEQAVKEGVYRSREDYGIAIYTFSDIWDSTIKKATDRALYGWVANPWVWVIEFEQCGKPETEPPDGDANNG